ncbi:siderophore-interacting protein [Rothia aerolata]|uniref:FAD-binding FR-type domain-containing protein n=1 Tax=Rothia aerolata TaxID=1812262 RepID=A0A917IUP9_9MICC|nr:siderophore-interacting protein [Rothia aerolata]GGH62311.1 hypothetical protein GCM10007359_12380 [Rothia aerolata]
MSPARPRRTPDHKQFGLFPVAVTRVQALSPHFVRISLAGESLHHAAEEISDGTGDVLDAYIKLMIAPEHSASGIIDLELTENWRSRYLSAPPQERGWMRTYTLRNSRLVPADRVPPVEAELRANSEADLAVLDRPLPAGQVPEVDIDFVLHQDDAGELGPGARWAATAQVGDKIALLAPLRGNALWSAWNPDHSSQVLMLVDETAVPAALSIARSLPAETRADLLLEVPCSDDVLSNDVAALAGALENLPGVDLHWLPRTGNTVRGENLFRGLRQVLDLPTPLGAVDTATRADEDETWTLAVPQTGGKGQRYVYIAGESSVIKTLRRICVNEAGIDKRQISFMGYWKKGVAEC